MSENSNQNSKIIFDGSYLKMTVDGPKYDGKKAKSLQETITKVGGGKRHSSLKSALKEFENSLRFK